MYCIHKCFILLCVVILLPCASCSKPRSNVKAVGVAGTVYLDGQPADNVKVTFVSTNSRFSSSGMTDANGKYSLPAGAEPGENEIIFSKAESGKFSSDPESGMDIGQFEAQAAVASDEGRPPSGQMMPAKFSDPNKPAASFTVPEDGTDSADFRLTSN